MGRLFNSYLSAVASAIRDRNGRELQELLNVANIDARQALFERTQNLPNSWSPQAECRAALRSLFRDANGWEELVTGHCSCLASLVKGKTVDAYQHLTSTIQPFIKEFREDKDAWLTLPLQGLAHNLRAVALAADEECRKAGRNAQNLENCGSHLQRCFATAMQGSGNKLKKAATLEIVITLFRVYFKLNTLRLCKNLIAAMQKMDFDVFPASQRVTYKFFTGRLAIFDDQYEVAESELEYALKHCHRNATKNKSRILYFLIPVKMLLGQLPTQDMLQQYNLGEYRDIVDAMRTGSVQKLNDSLEAHQWTFIRAGTYLVLEKLKQAVLRRLLKRVALIYAEQTPEKASQLPLGLLQKALEWQGMPADMDEVECLVANLIYRKYVKGYISHSKHVIVLSKQHAFPPLKSVNLSDLF